MASIEIPEPIITVENDWSWDDDDLTTVLALKVGGVTIIRKGRVLSSNGYYNEDLESLKDEIMAEFGERLKAVLNV